MCQLVETAPPAALPEPGTHDYWIVHGQAYDLSSYVASHPGGTDAILLGRGRDCTELFEQYHVMNNKHLRVLERYRVALPPAKSAKDGLHISATIGLAAEADAAAVVGVHAANGRIAHQSDPFYEDIKVMVREHGATKMAPGFVILHCLHFAALAYSLYLWVLGTHISAFVAPYFLWVLCAAMVHDGGHFALSKSPTVNILLNRLGALLTNSTGCWYLQHNVLHHSYTNVHGKDCDLDAHHPYIRLHPEQSIPPTSASRLLRVVGQLGMYPFAHIGFTLISPYSYYKGLRALGRKGTPGKVVQDTQTLAQFHSIIVLQVAVILLFFVTPFLRFDFPRACLLTMLPTFTMSTVFMVVAQVSHIQLDAEAPSADLEKLHWARRMALTSVDYSQGSLLWAYLTIGLNMQSLHHIVPGVSYTQLTSMYPKYRAICEKHGIRLLERRNLWHALCTHVQTLWELSKTHSFAQISRKVA